jgi:formate dehydrogenase iron-sulfur subunit
VQVLHDNGFTEARLYGANAEDGVGGTGSVFLLLDEPEVYGLPPDPVVTTRDLPAMWRAAAKGAAMVVGVAVSAVLASWRRK